MQDTSGVYYYPLPGHKSVRMYVRENGDLVEFRLHDDNEPQLWVEHGWLTYEAVRQAAELYTKSNKKSPLDLYDFDVALKVLHDAKHKAAAHSPSPEQE